jgi:hypothetical protein
VADSNRSIQYGLGIVCALGVVSLLNIFTLNLMLYFMIKFSIAVRSAMLSLIFQKSFRLSAAARAAQGSGEMLTLMSVDVERVWTSCLMWLWLGLSPLLFIVAMSILVSEVGFPGLFSGVTLLVWMVIQDYICKCRKSYYTPHYSPLIIIIHLIIHLIILARCVYFDTIAITECASR